MREPAEGVGAATALNDLQRDVTEMRREMNDFRRDMNDFRRDVNDFRQEMRVKEASCAPAREMRVNVKEASCAPAPEMRVIVKEASCAPAQNSVVAELVGGGGTETHGRRRLLSKDADKRRKGKERAMARGEGTDAGMTSIVFPKAERQLLGFWERCVRSIISVLPSSVARSLSSPLNPLFLSLTHTHTHTTHER